MRQRIHLRRRKKRKLSKRSFFLLSLLLIIVLVWGVIHIIGTKVNPVLLSYAKIETEHIATTIINEVVTKEISDELSQKELFEIVKNQEGEIQVVDFNSAVVNEILQMATEVVQDYLKKIEAGNIEKLNLPQVLMNKDFAKLKEGIVYEIPLGVLTGNSLLANFGPYIPVRMHFVGNMTGNIQTEINSYGINNALVEISINIEVTEQIITPLVSSEVPISTSIPVAIKMVQGKVPTYYQNGLNEKSNLYTLPME